MKEHPILFSAPMVRALLNGSKTQTRRVIKFNDRLGRWDSDGLYQVQEKTIAKVPWTHERVRWNITSTYGRPGDRLWVRETFSAGVHQLCDADHWVYAADPFAEQHRLGDKWKPSIFMPRAASRITLEITDVRVERLQDISVGDAQAEGVEQFNPSATSGLPACSAHRYAYEDLWKSINGPDSWDSNPWVWVIEFKRVTP